MALNPAFVTQLKSGESYFRITSPTFLTTDAAFHSQVVDGQGGVNSATGARYNYPGVETVYLTEDVETCLAEKMFYFHREVIRELDLIHILHSSSPKFERRFVLWKIQFKSDVDNIFDMESAGSLPFFGIYPSLTTNPSQDYKHLKEKRATIQSNGYLGLRAPSTRSTNGGFMVVVFKDQSSNVFSITPYHINFRLITDAGVPFNNHILETLDFTAGEVKVAGAALSSELLKYSSWSKIQFHH
ncbi:MAG TPA: RES family NAD+ phosphorylase [Pyrinomonadaceae bacterium]|nr:RES family NAD+ phosphorylase [Pyrinomonadaceae bacterium]